MNFSNLLMDGYMKIIHVFIHVIFKFFIDSSVTIEEIKKGSYPYEDDYADKYATIEVARFGFDVAQGRMSSLTTKLIALTQIHGAIFCFAALLGNPDSIASSILLYLSMAMNLISIAIVLFGLSIKNASEPIFSEFNENNGMSEKAHSDLVESISGIQCKCDFLCDVFKLAQFFLIASLALSAMSMVTKKASIPYQWVIKRVGILYSGFGNSGNKNDNQCSTNSPRNYPNVDWIYCPDGMIELLHQANYRDSLLIKQKVSLIGIPSRSQFVVMPMCPTR